MKGERRKLERDFREKESMKRLTTRSINTNRQASAWQRIPEADNLGETKYLSTGFWDDIDETEFLGNGQLIAIIAQDIGLFWPYRNI